MSFGRLLHIVLYGFVFIFLLFRGGWILLRGRMIKLMGRDRLEKDERVV